MQYGLGGIEFEFAIKARFEALGWHVETTSATGDFGADLVARSGNEVLVVQCKDYGSPAGIAAVQEAYFARVHYGASAAAVVARTGFMKAAIKKGLLPLVFKHFGQTMSLPEARLTGHIARPNLNVNESGFTKHTNGK